ncbi:helix-turn-helix transcriptional regulator [Halobacillus locisalis]|uniref:Helix-turn-helix transcriptional regulator n=1 Tax=Halobacillus locisalis TaxID=220753 RepID=A0A838CVZ9_9BACI|nr:helix-turn-helix transcriptional regulator [Halobacillus locisalis]MBA2176140.1 helix-turn-helix transcriptional regulator [Halobacillus locisalis]
MDTNKSKDIKHFLGTRLREIRIAKGLSQEELAFRAGYDRTYISGIEQGKKNPSLVTIGNIAASLEVPVHLLFIESSPKENH